MMDDTIVAIATPPGRGGIGVVRLSGPDASRLRGGASRVTSRSSRASPRSRVSWNPDASNPARAAPSSTRSSSPGLRRRIPTPARTSSRSAGTAARCCSQHIVELADRRRRAAGRARRIHAARVPERAARSGAGRSGGRSGGRRDAAAGARGDGSARGHADVAHRAIDAALFDLSARLEASLDFPDEGFHFVTREDTAAELARLRHDLDALASDGATGRVIREGRLVVIVGRAERRQVEPVQRARRQRARDRHGDSGHHARPADRASRSRAGSR